MRPQTLVTVMCLTAVLAVGMASNSQASPTLPEQNGTQPSTPKPRKRDHPHTGFEYDPDAYVPWIFVLNLDVPADKDLFNYIESAKASDYRFNRDAGAIISGDSTTS
ncbi:hypothetical protein BJ085DRAFT_39832 [Dimargaris cristalligena]|uniref:Uncharacterized protein n=1 Tax=Dimargaris cristalligena TaxID=215637 RepID=A0A4P9ZME8_9FUNG|nr:hypothetical protein BJ085DRAFT_39832 [Dimargaris cristalligena]|eukprot:RKP33741.1 hypothetical protein BJ085DRAFT_39832 [Dimargaris cristalligena]